MTNVPRLINHLGAELRPAPQLALCRCGNSSIKPLCDGSHASSGFRDAKDPKRVPDRRDTYDGQQLTIYDNRGICQHSGVCTDLLATVVDLPFAVPTLVAGVMLVEYVALSRLVHALTGRSLRQITAAVAVALVVTAPISLINPDGFYRDLLKPSLIALWLSQLIVSAVYPRFVSKRGGRRIPAWTLAVVSCAFAVYGMVVTIQHAVS